VKKEAEHNINDRIKAPQVRLVGENIKSDVYPLEEALRLAAELGVDLVEVVPTADPPVCRAIDYQKFLYEKRKKKKNLSQNKESKSSRKSVSVRIQTNMISTSK